MAVCCEHVNCPVADVDTKGPGCSSFDGALMEIGPVRVERTNDEAVPWHLRDSPGAWNEYADVLFSKSSDCVSSAETEPSASVDQPAGTGFSYITRGRPVAELAEVGSLLLRNIPV